MIKETTITLDDKFVKKLVKTLFYGACYTSAHKMRYDREAHKVFDTVVGMLEEQGWHYTMNGEIKEN
jgi:hypothetical protein